MARARQNERLFYIVISLLLKKLGEKLDKMENWRLCTRLSRAHKDNNRFSYFFLHSATLFDRSEFGCDVDLVDIRYRSFATAITNKDSFFFILLDMLRLWHTCVLLFVGPIFFSCLDCASVNAPFCVSIISVITLLLGSTLKSYEINKWYGKFFSIVVFLRRRRPKYVYRIVVFCSVFSFACSLPISFFLFRSCRNVKTTMPTKFTIHNRKLSWRTERKSQICGMFWRKVGRFIYKSFGNEFGQALILLWHVASLVKLAPSPSSSGRWKGRRALESSLAMRGSIRNE